MLILGAQNRIARSVRKNNFACACYFGWRQDHTHRDTSCKMTPEKKK
ncbi:hypothetical Protein YC6258_01640 [Gynuella sunshinyii YC6258]|uniref:Uncharacterized protein n=1 Tax=Gynuella sunshinyii YC6258 TaxID=1445510 RepID=A0A0C5VJZ0_9GAMM|nr:hypothetical Protein YC6258_01640 [Gynuella sunshinyii YC6258]